MLTAFEIWCHTRRNQISSSAQNGSVHLNLPGVWRQFSRLLAAEVCGISGSNAGYSVFRGSVKGTGYPLHSAVSPFSSPPVRHRVPSHYLDSTSQSQAWICCGLLVWIAGSNPTGDMDVCLLWLLYVLGQMFLRRADHFSRGVLRTVVCLSETTKPPSSGGYAHIGALLYGKQILIYEVSVKQWSYNTVKSARE